MSVYAFRLPVTRQRRALPTSIARACRADGVWYLDFSRDGTAYAGTIYPTLYELADAWDVLIHAPAYCDELGPSVLLTSIEPNQLKIADALRRWHASPAGTIEHEIASAQIHSLLLHFLDRTPVV